NVCSQDLAIRFAHDHLNEAFVFADGTSLAAGHEGHLANLELEAFLLRGALSKSNARHLRVTIRATRKDSHFLRAMAGNKKSLDGLDGLEAGDMCKPRRANDVPRGVNAGNRRFITFVDLDKAFLVQPDLQRSSGQHGSNSDGYQSDLCLDGLFGTFGVGDRDLNALVARLSFG